MNKRVCAIGITGVLVVATGVIFILGMESGTPSFDDDYNEIMSLVHSFHPTWELCNP